MISYFYSPGIAAGDKYIGRKGEAAELASNIKNHKFSTLYAPAGSGKASIVERGLQMLAQENYPLVKVEIDLFNITSLGQFLDIYSAPFRPYIDNYNREAIMPTVIDYGEIVPVVNLPHLAATYSNVNFLIYFKEFQNLMNIEDGEKVIRAMEKVVNNYKNVAYIASGSQLCAMKEIFEHRRFFFRSMANIPIGPLPKREAVSFLQRGFMNNGKDINDETASALYDFCKGHPGHLNRLAFILDSIAAGYVNRKALGAAQRDYISMMEGDFRLTMSRLTDNQVNFVRAVCDGIEKFSSAEILQEYHLNSSANVFRLKEALSRKEIVTFDAEDRASVIDPIFEYWLRNRYFATQQ